MTVDVSVGLAELVECVFDRKGAPASVMGVPIDKTVPDYCEVSVPFQTGASSSAVLCYVLAMAETPTVTRWQSTSEHPTPSFAQDSHPLTFSSNNTVTPRPPTLTPALQMFMPIVRVMIS